MNHPLCRADRKWRRLRAWGLRPWAGCLGGFACAALAASSTLAEPPAPAPPAVRVSVTAPVPAPNLLSRDAAVVWALEHNPEIASFRHD